MALFSFLFSPQAKNGHVISTDNVNKLLLCCVTVLQEDEALIQPYCIGYDSDEDALNLQQDQYKLLLEMVSKKVRKQLLSKFSYIYNH